MKQNDERCARCSGYPAELASPGQSLHQQDQRDPAAMSLAQPITLPRLPSPESVSPTLRDQPYVWQVPGSKSLTNRALIVAAIAAEQHGRPCHLHGVLASDDTRHMQTCLEQLGAQIEQIHGNDENGEGDQSSAPDRLSIAVPHGFHSNDQALFVGNSGTTVRFLSALCATIPGRHQLIGDEHMAKRPIADLVDALIQQDISVECATGCPPLTIHGGTLPGGTIAMPGHRSSQYFTALMMAGIRADQPLTINIIGDLVSRPYVTMTQGMLRSFGASVDVQEQSIHLHPSRLTAPTQGYQIEPDASAASYPLALAAATGYAITVPHLDQHALQGDVAFLDILQQTGAAVSHDQGLSVSSPGRSGVDIDMEHISDTVMSIAAIAPLLQGDTTIRNVGNIRIKETDRLHAVVTELRRLGQAVDEGDDWLRISPRPINNAAIECYADHRMAMSFAVLAAACDADITITDPSCVAKTYPNFWQDLSAFYAHVGVEFTLSQAQPVKETSCE